MLSLTRSPTKTLRHDARLYMQQSFCHFRHGLFNIYCNLTCGQRCPNWPMRTQASTCTSLSTCQILLPCTATRKPSIHCLPTYVSSIQLQYHGPQLRTYPMQCAGVTDSKAQWIAKNGLTCNAHMWDPQCTLHCMLDRMLGQTGELACATASCSRFSQSFIFANTFSICSSPQSLSGLFAP